MTGLGTSEPRGSSAISTVKGTAKPHGMEQLPDGRHHVHFSYEGSRGEQRVSAGLGTSEPHGTEQSPDVHQHIRPRTSRRCYEHPDRKPAAGQNLRLEEPKGTSSQVTSWHGSGSGMGEDPRPRDGSRFRGGVRRSAMLDGVELAARGTEGKLGASHPYKVVCPRLFGQRCYERNLGLEGPPHGTSSQVAHIGAVFWLAGGLVGAGRPSICPCRRRRGCQLVAEDEGGGSGGVCGASMEVPAARASGGMRSV